MKKKTVLIVGLIVLLLSGMIMAGCSSAPCNHNSGASCHVSLCENCDSCGYCVAVMSGATVQGRCGCK